MITITREQKLLLDLVSGEITGKKICLNEDVLNSCSWDILLEEAQAQAVQLMLAEPLSSYKDKINNWEQWQYVISCSVTANVRTAYYEQQLGKLLDGSLFFILKGMAAASYYPMPHERMLGDIDFLIDPSQKGKIEGLLENDGYEKHLENHICHVVFKKNDAHLEMHWEIAGIPYGKPGELIRKFMSDALLHCKTAEFDGWSFPVPDDVYHGLIILLHMQHHMLGEGIGIRHLCDWACYVQKTKDENFWDDLLLLFEKTGLLIYAKVMTKTCSIYLGIECPKWACDADKALCRDVIEDILTGGNFGRKDITRAKSGMMISEHGKNGTRRGKAANLFYALHHSTAIKYPIVRKIPLLYPFLDLWRALAYSIKVISGRRMSVTKLLPFAKQRRNVYKRLHIFEVVEKRL